MKPVVSLALAASLSAAAVAQNPSRSSAPARFSDPANLAGERVQPRDGRELPVDQGARGLEQMLRRLGTRASVLNIVAHPDDEDGGMLTFYARGMGARVADLSLTRGEGGQNAMTGDFEDALGLLRTQELLANDRWTGVSQMFGTEVDFGFSKTKAEAFGKWTHERVLYDAVRAIRIFRPLVITSTWVGGVTDGHGQHQVSGQIAQEAFVAAGDPKVFPEMEREGIYPWRPLRMYARVPHGAITAQGLYDYATNQYVPAEFHNYVTGKNSATVPSTDVVVHEGAVDPLLSAAGEGPVSYVQFARRGLSEQKSQVGPGFRSAPSGAFDVAYHLFGSRVCADAAAHADVMVAEEACVEAGVGAAEQKGTFFAGVDTSLVPVEGAGARDHADLVAATDRVLREMRGGNVEGREKMKDLLAARAEELRRESEALERVRGSFDALHELRVKLAQVELARLLVTGAELRASVPGANAALPVGQAFEVDAPVHGASAPKITAPAALRGHALAVSAADAARAKVTLPYFHRPNSEQPFYDLSDAALRNAPLAPAPLMVETELQGATMAVPVVVTAKDSLQPVYFVPAEEAARKAMRVVGYGDLPRTNFVERPARFVAPAGLKLPAKRRIAYVAGTGDAVPEALRAVGLAVTVLGVAELTPARLAAFDSVVLGVRTYTAHPELEGAPTAALLEFARAGGNVVVQYQSTEFTGADAPFPLSLGANEKVVDETAPVRLLDTASRVLAEPNAISAADFQGWIAERGHGFMETWDPRYAAATETHDPGAAEEHILPQKPQRGGLLTAQVGKGHWTYVAFALYRQLPEAVPGAYRLLMNLLAQ